VVTPGTSLRDLRASKMTVGAWMDRWLPTRETDLWKTSFERIASVCGRHIRPTWGNRALDDLSNLEIREWAATLQERLASRTARKVILIFRQLLDAAVDDRRLSVNPAARVPLPANEGSDREWMVPARRKPYATPSRPSTAWSSCSGTGVACVWERSRRFEGGTSTS